ncbi:MAG: cell wall hydrolase [Paracoccaceae bacterium]
MPSLKIVLLPILILLAACGSRSTPPPTTVDTNAHACLSEAIYFEAGNTDDGRIAVGEVILNRAADPRFPTSVCGVVDERTNGMCQFSYRCDGRTSAPKNPTTLALAQETARELLGGGHNNLTSGALFFHAAAIAPGWFGTLTRLGQFGGNIFYR